MMQAHLPVMVDEVAQWLQPRAGGLFVDATVGFGGHAAAVLEASGPDGRLIGIDQDPVALSAAAERLQPFGERVQLLHGNFADLSELLAGARPNGILFDVGVSSVQLDTPERGFSYREDGPLDMRMDTTQTRTAADLVHGLPEAELARIIAEYGEERWAKRIANFVVNRRPVKSTAHLVSIIRAAVPGRGPDHPARRTFQALRIAVNGELEALESGLRAAAAALAPGGRLVAISFHSLEDRIVKNFFRTLDGAHVLTKKPVRPSAAEEAANRRSRSARLRALEVC